jgi:hypothetical protein
LERRLAAGAALCGALVLAPSALAADPDWLAWEPAPECPDGAYIERRVSEWLAGGLPSKGQLAVRTNLTFDGAVWIVEVDVSLSGQSGKRRVAVADCNDAADFVAVTVVLAVDPSLEGSFDVPEGAEPSDPAPRAANGGETPPASKPKSEALVEEPGPVRSRKMPPRPHLSVGVEGAAGILPEPALGVGLDGGLDLGRLFLTLGGRWLLPRATSPSGSVAPIEFSLLAARLVAGYSFFGPKLLLGPTLSLEGGAILTSQGSPAARATAVPWVGLGVGGQGLFELSRRFGVFLQAELSVPLTQATFALSSGQAFHQAELGGRAEVGMRFFWTDR